MRGVWGIGWRLLVLGGATVLYAWAVFEFIFRRTYGRGLAGEGLTEEQMASVVEAMTRPVVYVFWVATALYLLLWVTVLASWISRANERE